MGLYAARLIDPVGWRAGTETGPYASVITESTTIRMMYLPMRRGAHYRINRESVFCADPARFAGVLSTQILNKNPQPVAFY